MPDTCPRCNSRLVVVTASGLACSNCGAGTSYAPKRRKPRRDVPEVPVRPAVKDWATRAYD